jgi:trk system potassium uptake protein TrkH
MSLSRISQFGSALMILTGSLGIYVIYDIMQRVSGKRPFMRAYSKLVIWATATLLVIAAFLLRYLGTKQGDLLPWLDSCFMAVSSCSAGFNSVPVDQLNDVSLALCMFLMLVGGAPGSTAGGLKISTVAIAAAAIWSTITGNRQTIIFRRHIPHDNVMKAFAVITLFAILVVAGSIAVKLTNPNQDLGDLLFESVSAICTVGLSIGDTSTKMTDPGKLVTMLLMYIGRIGPLTLLIFLLAREKPGKVQYPEERIIIG